MTNDETRVRTIAWQDPALSAQAVPTMTGMEFLRAIGDGTLPRPPIFELMAIQPHELDEGRIVFKVQPAEYHYNPIGVAHGGLAATILDTAMACAIQTTLPLGIACTTIEMKLNYLRPLTSTTGMVFCEGKIISVGRTIATAEGRIVDADGRLYAHGTETCLILRPDR